MLNKSEVFSLNNTHSFNEAALKLFHYQARHNEVYARYLRMIGVQQAGIKDVQSIPYLPVELFKTHKVITNWPGNAGREMYFESSSTTGTGLSRHYFSDPDWYQMSAITHFRSVFRDFTFRIAALLPGYTERENSSLIWMVRDLMQRYNGSDQYFFLNDFKTLMQQIAVNRLQGKRTMLFGVTHALVDFADWLSEPVPELLILETGGMKGRKREYTREELHQYLRLRMGVERIYGEYGMTELFSQAYHAGDGLFASPGWMQVSVRDREDPFRILEPGRTGGINVIDLANVQSCAFIATSDLGRVLDDGRFEVLGRFDHSDIRGCSLMVA